jgi:hypothetical protein
MPVESILFLCLVISALIGFASVLAYGERVSGRAPPEKRPRLEGSAEPRPLARPVTTATYKKAA